MKFGIMGPLFVVVDGTTVTPSAPKLRKLLAILLLHADKPVSIFSLMRMMWDGEPPATAVATIQTYVLQLRKLLAEALDVPVAEVARDVLTTRVSGYQVRPGPGGLDLADYRRLLSAGRQALDDGQAGPGIADLSSALDLWRGPALADVPTGPALEPTIRQLHESRLLALEYCVEAEIALGRYREAIMKLTADTHEYPTHEGLCGQLMRALYLSGRRAEALQLFHRLRNTLIVETGLEPGRRVQRLQHAMLTDTLAEATVF